MFDSVVEVLPCDLAHLVLCLELCQFQVGHHRTDDDDNARARGANDDGALDFRQTLAQELH